MILCTFEVDGVTFPGKIEGDRVVALRARTLVDYLVDGESPGRGKRSFPIDEVRLRAPVPNPPSVRDFYAFEQHVVTARRRRGLAMPEAWYEVPVFYFSNPSAIYGPGDCVPWPPETVELDYELEVAAVIGAGERIAGFTVLNDWSARDLQRREMSVGLGPSKGKDFATSMGPVLVTVDAFDGSGGTMIARVNGEERSRGELGDLHWKWADLVKHAAQNTQLRPGDILGTGTVGSGCILEHGDGRWLAPGDIVELEVEGIGVLTNSIAALS